MMRPVRQGRQITAEAVFAFSGPQFCRLFLQYRLNSGTGMITELLPAENGQTNRIIINMGILVWRLKQRRQA